MRRLIFQVTLTLLLIMVAPLSAADYALQFNGVNQYIDCGLGDSLKVANEVTVEAWILAPAIPDNVIWAIVSSQNDSAIAGIGLALDGYLNQSGYTNPRRHIDFQIGNGSWHCSFSNSIVPEDYWVHIAVTRKANEDAKFYYNGVQVLSTGLSWNGTVSYISNWNIGRQQDLGRYYSGIIDEVRIWNRAISGDEIINTMLAKLTGGEPNLVGGWNFDEGSGNITADATPNNNTGTLYNAPSWVPSDLMSTIQPDSQIRTDDESTFTGGDVYNDLNAQTKAQIAGPNVTSVYDIRVQNDRVAVDRFVLTASAANEYWDVNYYNVSSGNNITADITGAGWTTPVLASGGSLDLRLEVTPKSSIPDGSISEQIVTATSQSDANKFDEVKAVTMFSASAAQYGMTYTTNEDFNKGTLIGVEYQTAPNQLQLSTEATTLPFIWVPNSNQGTVSKVDTATGKELGRYRTCPASVNGNPSRTTVDLYGNCWVGNRNSGTVVKIGLLEAGQYMDRNQNGIIETSRDLNGDGEITGSELLPWASDECVIYEVVLIPGSEGTYIPGQYQGTYANDYYNPGPRGIAVDAYNNIWVGCYGSMKYYYIDGSNGQIIKTIDVSSVNHTPYGAVVDESGILWSAANDKNHVLRLNPTNDSYSTVNLGHISYGLGLDRSGHLFVTGATNNKISRINVLTGTVDWTKDWPGNCPTGAACTDDGDVWTADRYGGTVTRGSNDGVVKATITAGNQPAGVAVDAEGKVWMVDAASEYIYRIDPDTNTVDLSKRITGTTHYGYSDMTGIISRTATTRIGTWSVTHNTRQFNSPWGAISWTSSEPRGTSIKVKVRSSNNRQTWSWWEDVENYKALRLTPEGRYLQVMATFQSMQEEATPILYDLTVNPSPCCGDLEHPYPRSDINKDCKIDLLDFAIMASEWLNCASPACD